MTKKEHFVNTSLDAEIVQELLPQFLQEINQEFEKLLQSFNLNDLNAVYEIAHKIKGATQSFGAHYIERNTKHILQMLEAKNTTHLIEAIENLRIEINQLIQLYG